MRSIPAVMIWDMLRHGYGWLIGGFLCASALPVLLFTALSQHGPLDLEEPSFVTIHLAMIEINIFVFTSAIMSAHHSPSRTFRMYTLQITNFSLAACNLIPAMILAGLEVFLSTYLLNLTVGLNWPLLGPSLVAATSALVIQAAIYQTEKPLWLALFVASAALVLGLWFKSRYGSMFDLASYYWHEVTFSDVLTLSLFSIIAFYLAVLGVARNRRGDALPSFDFLAWAEQRIGAFNVTQTPFQSPIAAQAWFNWRRSGWQMPTATLFILILGLVSWTIFSRKPDELVDGLIAGGGILTLVGVVGGLLVGNAGPTDINFEIGHFQATRPLTNPQMATSLLKTAAKSVGICWSLWAVTALSTFSIFELCGISAPISVRQNEYWLYIMATALGPWIVLTAFGAIGLTGRGHHFATALISAISVFLIGNWASHQYLNLNERQFIGNAIFVTCSIAAMAGIGFLFVAAIRHKYTTFSAASLLLGAWLAISSMFLVRWAIYDSMRFPFAVFLCAAAAAAISPPASFPLAIFWNRHR